MAGEAPPSFSASIGDSEASLPPGYHDGGHSTHSSLIERVYTLETSKKKPWAFLKVKGRGKNAASIPRIVQGEPIMGTVELDLEKTDHIQAVTVEASKFAFLPSCDTEISCDGRSKENHWLSDKNPSDF